MVKLAGTKLVVHVPKSRTRQANRVHAKLLTLKNRVSKQETRVSLVISESGDPRVEFERAIMTGVRLNSGHKSYGGTDPVCDLRLSATEGEFVVFVVTRPDADRGSDGTDPVNAGRMYLFDHASGRAI